MTQQHHLNHATWDCKYHVVSYRSIERKRSSGRSRRILRRVPRLGQTAGMQDRGRPFDARSCAHAGLDPTKILGRRGGRLHQGQKLDLDRAEYRAKGEELHRAQVLGAWIFRLDGGPRRETIRAYIRSFWIGRWINLRRSHSPITKVAKSFQTAFSDSPPYHQPSWWLLT